MGLISREVVFKPRGVIGCVVQSGGAVGMFCRWMRLCCLLSGILTLVAGNVSADLDDCFSRNRQYFARGSRQYRNLSSLNFVNETDRSARGFIVARDVRDVADGVRCARKMGVGVCARSGGHSLMGKSICDGVVIDVGGMRGVSIRGDGIASVEGGNNVGELLWKLHERGRWFSAGVCPGVGVGGYMFGGGQGPYHGLLGLACDSVVEVTIVDRHGRVLVVSDKANAELFWGLCGAGGSQYGIVTSFKIRTVSARPYDRGVIFRFNWEQRVAGRVLSKWQTYDEMGGKVWFRKEQNEDRVNVTGLNGFGACYDVGSIAECWGRLRKAEFFRIPGRRTVFMKKTSNALQLHAFYRPGGNWGRRPATDLRKAMLGQRYADKGAANGRIYKSGFLRFRNGTTADPRFWQVYSEFCANTGLKTINWLVCEMNLLRNAVALPRNNAFAYRDTDIIVHLIIGGGNERDKIAAYRWMEKHFEKWSVGVYVNYPEIQLGDRYADMYWGKSLKRLAKLKTVFDPQGFFLNSQPIPLVS